MKNNQYTATPNWFKDVQQQQPVVTTQTNYYIGGASVSGSGGLQSINLYNKFKIESYRITADDLLIKNNAIIAADIPLSEGEERPEDFVSEIGNNVEATNWHTSYLISVVSGTNLIANLKANSNRYGIVFYDEYNQPISGYTPTVDELATIPVPENARYFRCCHYIEPVVEPVEEPVEPTYEFYIEYTGMGNYEDSDLNIAYGGIFDNFTNTNSSVPEGINTKQLSTSDLNLIFQQPLSCTIDKSNNIKIGLDKIFTDSVENITILTENDTTTIPSDTNIFSALRTLKEIKKVQDLWKLIEDEQGNKYIITDYNVVGKGGITAYYNDDLNPGEGGGLGGGGSIANIQIIGEGNALSDVTLSEDKLLLTFTKFEAVQKDWITAELKKYVDKESAQEITGLKNFVNGLSIGSKLLNIIEGVLYINCDVAVTGGITTYASGSTDISTIMDGVVVDGITIDKVNGALKVIGDIGGASNWDELEGKPEWITDTVPPVSTFTNDAGYITNAALNGYATQSWVNNQGFATQTWVSDNYLLKSSYTASDILSKLKTVDGSGSGLDADLLDGYHASGLLTSMSSSRSTNLSITVGGHTESLSTLHVDYAQQLENTRTIWGQNFDGTANVSGTLTSVDDIHGSGTFYSSNSEITNSLYIGGIRLYKSQTGVITIDGDLAITGGITTYAQGSRTVSTIMDGVTVDGTTISKEGGVLKVIGGTGGGGGSTAWGDITGKPSWLTTSKPSVSYFTNDAGYVKARNIWGQYYDGSSDITGEIKGCSRIHNNGSSLYLGNSNNASYVYVQDIVSQSGSRYWKITQNGVAYFASKLGVGTTSPSQRLHVAGSTLIEDTTFINCKRSTRYLFFIDNGDSSNYGGYIKYIAGNRLVLGTRGTAYVDTEALYITRGSKDVTIIGDLIVKGNILSEGGITAYSQGDRTPSTIMDGVAVDGTTISKDSPGSVTDASDIRMKDVVSEIKLNIHDIASMPTVRYRWKDYLNRDKDLHAGGIAQSVRNILPETVIEGDGVMGLDYSTTAYIFAVQTARHLVKTDTEVEKLKKRVKELEKQLKQLGYEETNIMDDKDI